MPQLFRLRPLALALLLSASTVAGAQGNNSYVEGLEDSIAAYTVSDFASHGPQPDGFRHVKLRFRETDTGTRSYLLCGQVHIGTGAKAEWADFATIKTDPYEQWLGGPAADMCAKATPVTGGRDLAPLLEQQLGPKASQPTAP
ncbi:hypothetical protein ASD22_10675 [Rhodanobacter sp. Root480]|uniref:hypothetical protein n=1 Tax=Rhodanobacter sp. Root480 TaxID=1736542 RepID=UPI0006F30CD6|nr:hypothetical protein [Rhodanobacter sp. Root480]KQX97681.1 hypothetical protein ASD22_10675 [Rhodanobacter sp. Root480]